MKIIAVVMHIVVICLLSYVFFKAGAPDKLIDWAWRVLFIALPLINLYILFKIRKVKKKPR
jgi:phosphoglycerol transferase MdoB-like AlkP superfamily enzyme